MFSSKLFIHRLGDASVLYLDYGRLDMLSFVRIAVSGNSLCLQCFPRFPALQTQFPVSGLQELPRHSQSSLQYNPYFPRGQANRAEKINKSIYIYMYIYK
jgi:hypothetical protein